MFDKLRNMASMLGQAKDMQQKMALLQEELAKKTILGQAGGGAIRVMMNGRFQVTDVQLDPAVLASLSCAQAAASQKIAQQLIAQAFNDALAQAQELARQEMKRVVGFDPGDLPPP